MSDDATGADAPPKSGLKRMLKLALPVGALLGGVASTWLGLWSPLALIGGGVTAAPAHAAASPPAVTFVDVPRVVLTIPGGNGRSLALTAMIEIDPAHEAQARQLMPRVSDAFNTFLSGIDPAAFDRRGILEIIRTELATRAGFVLGDDVVRDLLITEFRIQ